MPILEKKDEEVAPPKPDPQEKNAHKDAREQGPGVQKLIELCQQSGGRPAPAEVVEIFDAYPNEHNALMRTGQRLLGNAFIDQIVPQLKLTQRFQTPADWK